MSKGYLPGFKAASRCTKTIWPSILTAKKVGPRKATFDSFACVSFLPSSPVLGRKKGLNLIHFLTWRKTRTKNLKTTEFLELCGRVSSLILSRYVSDFIWTIVKISWLGIYAKSFRIRQSSVHTRLVDFLENRNAFLLL
jgi:hypothetical protein